MPRFTVKDMLVATAIVAVGALLIGVTRTVPAGGVGRESSLWIPVCAYAGAAIIGAGLIYPFRPWWALAWTYVVALVVGSLTVYWS